MDDEHATPRPVRLAGLLVGIQGVASVAVAVRLLVAVIVGSTEPAPLATAVWFAGSGAALLAIGVNLVRGWQGARTPAVVVQILLLGVSWYAAGPSSQPAYGLPAAAFCLIVLVLLFCPPAVRWATGQGGAVGRGGAVGGDGAGRPDQGTGRGGVGKSGRATGRRQID